MLAETANQWTGINYYYRLERSQQEIQGNLSSWKAKIYKNNY